jgi:two-component system CheB/CheR fusion protein
VLPESSEFMVEEIEYDFERIGRRAMLLNARPLDGAQLILLGMVDITERKRAEEHKDLLLSELSHRVKNTLAVVQALAMQTNGTGSVEAFREAFTGRLQVLARAHSLLLERQWQGADLRPLVEQVLEPYRAERPERIAIEGGSVMLTPGQGLAISMILHELATNAAKYGALTAEEGHVDLSWQTHAASAPQVHLRWQETGGPAVGEPGSSGFGLRLIERAASHELQGELELNYARDGLFCEVSFPLT